MSYTDIEIQQAIATVESKLTMQAYSTYLKDHYGLKNYCGQNLIGCLLLFRFALENWDNRVGAVTNPYTLLGLSAIIKRINAL